jgi:hypothetical protein
MYLYEEDKAIKHIRRNYQIPDAITLGFPILTSGPIHCLETRFAFMKVPFRLTFAFLCIGSSISFWVF